MSLPRVHQLLHGYRNGHELLAGSVKLAPGDAELVARLSDLSGTLQSDVKFHPYVTAYPLPSGLYYAIARTWLDKNAPRSGCVLTRTALVAMADWQNGDISLSNVLNALSQPSRGEAVLFQGPLAIDTGSFLPAQLLVSLPEVEAFAAKYFGEGIRPVVWLRDGDAEDILVSISRVLWPQLRRRFAACTLSLQPRNLADAPFDLLFAPTAVYSRFTKVPRENLIDTSNGAKLRQGTEEWIIKLTELIYASKPLPVPSDWPDLSKALGAEPTSVRWLYLLNDLRERTRQSPTAALGAMDVVERLCPQSNAEIQLKGSIANSALWATDQIEDPQQALSFLQLVCERLSHTSYSEVGEKVLDNLRSRVRRWARQFLDQALACYEELMGRTASGDRARDSFRLGLIDGVKEIGETHSLELLSLHKFDAAATDIVPFYSVIGRDYLKLPVHEQIVPSKDLVRWLQNQPSGVDWNEWASMLGLIENDKVVGDELFRECLSRLSEEDVRPFLSNVWDLEDRAILSLAVEKYLVPTAPLEVRRWALSLGMRSPSGIRMASATFERSLTGLRELLDGTAVDLDTKNAVLVQFVSRIPSGHFPKWFGDALDQRPDIVVRIVEAAVAERDRAHEVLSRVLLELNVLPSRAVDLLVPMIDGIGSGAVLNDICPVVVHSILAWTLRGMRDIAKLKEIDTIPSLSASIADIDGARLANIFSAEIGRNRENYGRAWLVLAEAPDAIYRSRRVSAIAVINQLLRQGSSNWNRDISDVWQVILNRSKLLCEPRYYVRHCVQALAFSLESNRLPVGAVARTAFPDVYKAVAEQTPYGEEANSLLSYDWDRAKGLRRNLVDTFYQSSWPEGDLALAAVESFGLRKLFRRVWRKWSGEEYMSRVIADLRRRNTPLATSCMNELISYCEKPNFYEPWD